jgi:hypothetical protein
VTIQVFDEGRARRGLEDFAAGTISAAELEERLGGRLRLRHPLNSSAVQINDLLPSVRLTRVHVSSILVRALRGELDSAAIARWAGLVLLLNGSHLVSEPTAEPCYGLDGPGPQQSTLSRILWNLAAAAAAATLDEAQLRRWLDELTNEAA